MSALIISLMQCAAAGRGKWVVVVVVVEGAGRIRNVGRTCERGKIYDYISKSSVL